jgi:hypothetical protein
MQQQRQREGKATARKTGRKEESARKNIVSVRVSDQERQLLEQITKKTYRNVSDLVREAIECWVTSNRKKLCLDS